MGCFPKDWLALEQEQHAGCQGVRRVIVCQTEMAD